VLTALNFLYYFDRFQSPAIYNRNQVLFQDSSGDICGDHSDNYTRRFLSTSFYFRYRSIDISYSFTCCCYKYNMLERAGNLQM